MCMEGSVSTLTRNSKGRIWVSKGHDFMHILRKKEGKIK